MCDHCSTFKPLLEGPDPARVYEDRPPIVNGSPIKPRSDAPDTGCCSWRQTCCDGMCCSLVGNCCSSQPEARYTPPEKATPVHGYGYGYQPAMSSYSLGMTAATMPDRVPCKSTIREEKKLPMCYGGNCQDSAESKPDASESTPRQSER